MNRILIVDDDPFQNVLNQAVLNKVKSNLRIQTALNGREALDLIEQQGSPDLMLLDIDMPVMDGFQLLEVLKVKGLCPPEETKIVVLTSSFKIIEKQAVTGYSVAAYMEKPFTKKMAIKLFSEDYSFMKNGGLQAGGTQFSPV